MQSPVIGYNSELNIVFKNLLETELKKQPHKPKLTMKLFNRIRKSYLTFFILFASVLFLSTTANSAIVNIGTSSNSLITRYKIPLLMELPRFVFNTLLSKKSLGSLYEISTPFKL